ncbi:MAG TPA: DegT/DnrJ/EryC1/StrS aminotransferase [Anaerolineaceae bacterium]|nr:DegT/DnrJ/EryC1/StrS aminotransferase [Anaerolineaceae bacterium]
MEWRVPLADLDYGDEEIKAVTDVLRSKWLTMGEITQNFEEEFAKMCGSKHAVAVSNATQALHLACLALGIGPGDEVIVPSLSFVATSNAVLYCSAKVKFVDIIDPKELTIDPNAIARAINENTKAIIIMHYAGFPCRMDDILAVAEEHHLPVIEDAAHAAGSFLDGKGLGTFGEIGCFSFFSNKNLSVGEGGMVVCERDDIAEKVRLLRSHGMTSLTYDRHQGHAFSYDVVETGYNYRIDEIRSSLGLVQLEKLAANNKRRGEITQTYWDAFQEHGIGLPFSHLKQAQFSYHIFPIMLSSEVNRLEFMSALRDAGIQSSIHYRPIHTFTNYQAEYRKTWLPITDYAASREVTLPLFPTMTPDQQAYVIENVIRLVTGK